MDRIRWPEKFPKEEMMISVIRKTITSSWKNNLTIDDVNKWLDNFSGRVYCPDDEKKMALWMLCNFTYYNENEINHLCRMIYKNLLHDIAQRDGLDSNEKLADAFKNIYFAAMGNAGESGGLLLYFFRQESGISMDRFCYPSAIPNDEAKTVVFIDDVTLSGGTAIRFFHNNLKAMKYKYAYYITLFASQEAVNRLTELGINVLYCTLLDERDKCFSDKSIMFLEFPELREPARRIAEEYGKILASDRPLGYKNGQYCFGFHYNIPNNSLPVFWSDNGWYPIFPRKEKIHNVKQRNNKFERYI